MSGGDDKEMRSATRPRRKVPGAALPPRQALRATARATGCNLSTVGDVERLAGVCSEDERVALWESFRHLREGPVQTYIDAVMDHCSEIALRRIGCGELSLVRSHA